MDVIKVKNLKKYYQVYKKKPGLIGSIKSLLTREYQQVKAVDGVSFTIKKGELVGFIGPNGAGKTTALKCLSGLLYPTGGKVEVLGFDPWNRKEAFLKQISLVMGQKNQLWWDLPPRETFILNKEIYQIPEAKFKKVFNNLTEILEVEDILDIQVRKLSLGQRMKCELIASLLHSPKVLFLDEPTIGLDVVMQKKMRDFIKVYNQKYQASVILTSHYMGDVQKLCQRLIIINKGKIIFDGRLKEVIEKYADYKIIKVVFSDRIKVKELAQVGKVQEFDYPKAVLKVKRETASSTAGKLLKDFSIADLNIEESSIEDIIRRLFTDKSVV